MARLQATPSSIPALPSQAQEQSTATRQTTTEAQSVQENSLKTLTVDGYTQKFGTFLIDIAGQFSVLNALGSADPNGYLTPVLLNGFTPEIGDSFTFIRCFEFGVSGSDEPFSRPLLHY